MSSKMLLNAANFFVDKYITVKVANSFADQCISLKTDNKRIQKDVKNNFLKTSKFIFPRDFRITEIPLGENILFLNQPRSGMTTFFNELKERYYHNGYKIRELGLVNAYNDSNSFQVLDSDSPLECFEKYKYEEPLIHFDFSNFNLLHSELIQKNLLKQILNEIKSNDSGRLLYVFDSFDLLFYKDRVYDQIFIDLIEASLDKPNVNLMFGVNIDSKNHTFFQPILNEFCSIKINSTFEKLSSEEKKLLGYETDDSIFDNFTQTKSSSFRYLGLKRKGDPNKLYFYSANRKYWGSKFKQFKILKQGIFGSPKLSNIKGLV